MIWPWTSTSPAAGSRSPAARGIGAAIAAAFADEGAAVALCARDGDAVEEAVAGLVARGVPAWGRRWTWPTAPLSRRS